MSLQVCSEHPETDAKYRCEGCEKLLCDECIQTGHALLFCKQCGERAVPLHAAQPATATEQRRHQAVARPYSFAEALLYPFRGKGPYLYGATLVTLALLQFFRLGCLGWILTLGFWSLLVGMQFKIVRSTAGGEDELPDWPDYSDILERISDILAYIFIALLQFGPLAGWIYLGGFDALAEPSLLYWAGVAFTAWFGAALGVMAFGAAGTFGLFQVIRLDLHVKGFLRSGADALTAANLIFCLGVAVFVVRAVVSLVPFLGPAMGGILGAYWIFTGPHIIGVLFRRHLFDFEGLYE